jgi:pullulanase
MHWRDFTADPSSGLKNLGKYLSLTEETGVSGINHLKELGVTHIHIMPSYDYASVDETTLEEHNYNWGYDPLNYNVPDGSYSTNPYDPAIRINEFKQMVMACHKAGIRVIMDVV